jgi:hypothetical protein
MDIHTNFYYNIKLLELKGKNMKRTLFVLISLIVLPVIAGGQEPIQSAQLNISIPALVWKGVRLKNLPAQALVAVETSTDNPLLVILLNQSDYEKLPLISNPLFKGDVWEKLAFSVTIPVFGDYYLVLDNSKGVREAGATVKISAGRGEDVRGDTFDNDTASDAAPSGFKLSQINEQLAKIFIFEPFPITVNTCGEPDAYSKKDSIVLCQEYIAKLHSSLDDKEKTAEVLLFVVFHEIGHILLYQWGYPFYDNEEVADEFATVLLVMVGKKEQLRTTAKYLASNTAVTEILGKTFKNDRHPLSIQRARNIVNWVNDRDRLERWQSVFVPHLQTSVLQRWQQEGKGGSLLQQIEEELGRRKNSIQ